MCVKSAKNIQFNGQFFKICDNVNFFKGSCNLNFVAKFYPITNPRFLSY